MTTDMAARVAAPDAAARGRRRLEPFWGLVAGLVAVGLGLWVMGAAAPEASSKVLGANVGVNNGAGDLTDIASHNSPGIARNPVQPSDFAVANRVDTPTFSCGLHLSFDAGATWADAELPFPAGEEAPPRCFVPDPAYGPDGTLFVSFSTLTGAGNRPNALWVVSSTDGGRSFSTPMRALGPLAFQPRLVADPSTVGRLYLTWLQAAETVNLGFAGAGNPINVARSDDGGRTWSEPTPIHAASRQRVVAPSPAVGKGGALYVSFLDLADDRLDYNGAHEGKGGEPYDGAWQLVVSRSTDKGVSWDETVVDDGVAPAERIVAFLPASPSIAADRRDGRVYVAFSDARQGDADVWLWRSGDGGVSFSAAERVNDTARQDGRSQYLPAVGVAANGRVDVVYYDRRGDPENAFNQVSLQSSFDDGASFNESVRLSEAAFDAGIGWGSESQLPDLGSRLALQSEDDGALAVWTDTRAGTLASNKQDLARAIVAIAPASGMGPVLKVVGVVAVLVALGVLLMRAGRRRPKAAAAG